ncbi:MAG: H-type lectin domain-containing protein [Pseudomonadota bacterium]
MRVFTNQAIGVDQGEETLFSEYQDGGDMWTGHGPRVRRRTVHFKRAFRATPSVHISLSMWDMDHAGNGRVDLTTENVTEQSFDAVFRTWEDTRIARARIRWMAIGPIAHADDWELY